MHAHDLRMTRHKVAKRTPPTTSARGAPIVAHLEAEDLAPSPSPGKVLSTPDGTSTEWVDAGGGGPHTHAIDDTTGLQAALDGKAASAHDHDWASITSKPTTFAPVIGSGAADAVAGNDARLTDARAPTAHTHTIANVTSLQATLDGKAAASHTHATSEVTGLDAALTAREITANKGAANGYASLGADGKVPSAQLPASGSSVDQTSSPTLPVGFLAANLTATKVITSTNSFAVYMGRAGAAYTTITLRLRVTTAAATITWAEVAIATGAPVLGGNPSLTRRGFTNTAAIVNSAGQKSIAVTVSGIAAGDHLWAIIGNQATTAAVIRGGLADDLQAGTQASVVVRPSLMATPQTFTLEGATAVCPWIAMTCA